MNKTLEQAPHYFEFERWRMGITKGKHTSVSDLYEYFIENILNQQSQVVSGEVDELAKEFANDIIGSLDWLDINGQTDWSNVYEAFKSGYAAAQQSGDGWVSVSSLKKLITNMKDKNFLESVIIEEVERNLDNPERLHKVFPPSNP